MEQHQYDLLIIGSGTAGLVAGMYAGRYGLKTIIIGESFGGEGTTAGETTNYPGIMAIDGYDLMLSIRRQVEQFTIPIIDSRVTLIERQGHCFLARTKDTEILATGIIFASGSNRRRLGLQNEEAFTAKGVHYCITCDGPLYKNKTVAVVGGGDGSVKGTLLIAQYVKKVYLIVRGSQTSAEPINMEYLKSLGEKVEVLYENEVTAIDGQERLTSIQLKKAVNGSTALPIDGLFVEIGAAPNVDLAKQVGVTLDEQGYIAVDNMMRTNVDGVFAAGDAVNHFGRFKQYVTAAALGAVAATSAYEDNKIHGDLCERHAKPSISENL